MQPDELLSTPSVKLERVVGSDLKLEVGMISAVLKKVLLDNR